MAKSEFEHFFVWSEKKHFLDTLHPVNKIVSSNFFNIMIVTFVLSCIGNVGALQIWRLIIQIIGLSFILYVYEFILTP